MRHPVAAIARPTYLRFLFPIGITACRIRLNLTPLLISVYRRSEYQLSTSIKR
jgi:hypothetical protein